MATSTLGAAIVALPDRGPRVVSFSRAHGPGLVDTLGAGVMFAGWGVFLVALWRRRWIIRAAAAGRGPAIAFSAGLGKGLVVASAGAD